MSSIYQPVGRDSHSTVQVGDYLYMWGGDQPGLPAVHNDEEKQSICSVVEVCHLPTGTWVQKPTTGGPPLGVQAYAAAVIRNEIFFYGGFCGHDKCYHNSLYSFNVDTFNWKELSPTTSHHGPKMKAGCGMVALCINDEDYLAVIGGLGPIDNNTPPQPGAQYREEAYQRCNEVHFYRLKTDEWTSPTVTGDRPPPINSFTLTSITNTTAILFGGDIDQDNESNDVYTFEFANMSVKCTKLSNPGGSVQWPKKRSSHSSVLINCSSGPYLLVMGGIGGYPTKDCWLLNINKMEWKKLTKIPDSVTEMIGHSLSVWNETQTTHWIIEFGGKGNDTTFIEIISSTGDLVVQSVLDINEYQKRRIKDILDKKPQKGDLLRLFKSSSAHYSTIGTALDVQVDDLLHSPMLASDKLILVFQRWIDSNRGVTWRTVLQVCEDFPDQLGQAKAEVEGFLSSDRARYNY
ncbi:PREDICTED: kelch domain-containing protein 1-like isoform X2 [Amphimedon queenslandica]|uniref:Death domain-containing protein n=1 Tax=Amphimedon queenslandica TaxID=400682 RepID=A0AAN0JIF8_AMPQE|nr:PREDICTED: kelch domain-containing protein 1-like isoform X2 [Amphimedon queenslandica]|eukprot:XP_019856586.1 PREDICTED: kelch domain-containing protein 1-like isoform X2 [Amphimedon queenslandica]